MNVAPNAIARDLAQKLLKKKFDDYQPKAIYTYTDINGLPLYYRFRLDHKITKDKFVRPFYFDGNHWVIKKPELPIQPLYGVDRLARFADQDVYLVEGEKCVDALTKMGVLAVTNGGATDWSNVDLSPLKYRSVVLWRDNDEAGNKWLAEAKKRLESVTQTIQVIDVPALNLPEKGDCVDWLKNNPAANLKALPTVQSEALVDIDTQLKTVCAADIKPEAYSWLWPEWIARKKLTLLAGAAGTGKTTAALNLAAILTSEGYWPDGLPCREAGNVLMWSSEDDLSDTLVPRLMAAGANLNRVHFIDGIKTGSDARAFDPATDIPLLHAKVKAIGGAALLIIDPIVSAVSGDMHKANDVRRSLQFVVDFAAQNDCAVLGITHFAKGGQGSSPLDRVIGSQAFGAIARMVLNAAQQENGSGCILVRSKCNIAVHDGGVRYSIEPVTIGDGIKTTKTVWGELLEGNARELLNSIEGGEKKRTDTDEAMELLPMILIGEMLSRDVIAAMKSEGFSKKVTQTAFKRLNGQSRREGFGTEMKSYWSLKSSFIPTAPIHSQRKELGTNEETGNEWTGETIL